LKSFSERHGFVPEREIQVDSMDDDLKRRIIDVIYEHVETIPRKLVWTMWVKRSVSELWDWDSAKLDLMKKLKETQTHHEVYSLVELIVRGLGEDYVDPLYGPSSALKSMFVDNMNEVLAENMSAWRIEGDTVVLAVGEAEIMTIRKAASISEENAGYVKRALKAMGPTDPDFEDSITQSFKMAENTLVKVGGSGSGLGRKLDSVVRSLEIPGNIVESFKQMNTFANEFARHPHDKAEYESDRNDAMLTLVWFSAMSAYLHSRWRDRGDGA